MQIINVIGSGKNRKYRWPGGDIETYQIWIKYFARAESGEHEIIIGYGKRFAYGKRRLRIVIWIDNYPHAEFIEADDYKFSGDVLSEIRLSTGDRSEIMCRYPNDPIPERYTAFNCVGLPIRISSKGIHNAWAVITNISDHKTMIAFAAMKRIERRSS
jgi:hypothetical protein